MRKKIEKNYSRSIELFKYLGVDTFVEGLQNNLKIPTIYKLFPLIYSKKLEQNLSLSKKYVLMAKRSYKLLKDIEKQEINYKDMVNMIKNER